MAASNTTDPDQFEGPLSGIRIIEIGANITAPMGTCMLADQGADVIKVENGTGDQMRYASGYRVPGLSSVFATTNRNKRSILVDLKTEKGLEAVKALIATADVVVQNFRPGVIDRLGLGYEAARAIKDDIIYLSISGVGPSGPDVKRRVYDPVIQGAACMASVQRDMDTGEPRVLQTAAADKVTAMTVAQAISAALFGRTRTGRGQHVEISMLRACLYFMWPDSMGNDTFHGEGAVSAGTAQDTRLIYKTKDDYILVAALANDEWAGMVRSVGRDELIDDPRFKELPIRLKHLKEIYVELKDAFLTRTTAEWLPILQQNDAVFARINRPSDVHLDPQVIASGVIAEFEHPIAGAYRQPMAPAMFDGKLMPIRRHAPVLGEHTEQLLDELGLAKARVEEMS